MKRYNQQIVYFSYNQWDTIFQRPQHIACGLSRYFQVLYVDPCAYSIFGYFRNRFFEDKTRNFRSVYREINGDLSIFTPPPMLPFSKDSTTINSINHFVLRWMVDHIQMRESSIRPILWISSPFHLPLIGAMNEIMVCYDCMDHYSSFFPLGSKRARRIEQLENELLDKTDVVFTSSLSLKNRIKDRNANVHLIRNAVSDLFLNYDTKLSGQLPQDWPTGNGPVIGYIGYISRWLDFKAIEEVANRHPDWRVVFIGPSDIDVSAFNKFSNIYFLGQKPYHLLMDYVSRFDVALIPFVMNELTRNVNPVKIYEYFSLGKPVVATSLPELSAFKDLCYLAGSTDELIENIELAVNDILHNSNQQEMEFQRRKSAKENTWNLRIAEVIRIMEQYQGQFFYD